MTQQAILAAPAPALYVPNPELPAAVLVDVDGTVALRGERGPFEFARCGEDAPNEPVIAVVNAMVAVGYRTVFCSGRPETYRDVTTRWLVEHVHAAGSPLYMRPADDYRRDDIVKLKLFDEHIRDQFNVLCVFDDRRRVVEMWRSLGLTVLAVSDGDF